MHNHLTAVLAETVLYSEPDIPSAARAKSVEQEQDPTKTESQSMQSKTSHVEKITKQPQGVMYDELVGPGHCKGLKTDPPVKSTQSSSTQKYSVLHLEESSEQQKEQEDELIPLYSIPDKTKKMESRQKNSTMRAKETEMSRSQTLVDNSPPQIEHRTMAMGGPELKTPSPPPPILPPKPGLSSQAEEDEQKDCEEETYAEVSSRPPPSSGQWTSQSMGGNSIPAIDMGGPANTHHLTTQNITSKDSGQGDFTRSLSLGDYCNPGSEADNLQQSLDEEFHRLLYDEPLNLNLLSLNSAAMAPSHDGRQEDDRMGYFRAS